MTLRHYLSVLRKRWRIMIGAIVIAVAAAVGITALMTPTYTALATSYVKLAATSDQSTTSYQNSLVINRVQSYTRLVDSPSVLQPVIDQYHLQTSVENLAKRVDATTPTNTFLLNVTATDGNAVMARNIANAVSTNLATEIKRVESNPNSSASQVAVYLGVPAFTPHTPVSPRPVLNVLLGLLVGIALGIAAAILRDQLDTRVKSVADLNALSKTTALGSVRNDPEFAAQPLVALHRSRHTIEDFRTIRTNLQYVNVDDRPRQIVISSAVAQEGKSITSCNLALTLGQADLSVCLVEGDLRKPKVADYFGIDGSVGLTDVIAGELALDDVLVPWHRGELTILPAGTAPPDPSHILGSRAMADLLATLRKRFDVVLIDAPPLLPVSDAAVLGAVSDGVILVGRYRHVRREQFAAAVESLAAVNADLLGTVLTQVPIKEQVGRYGSEYGYGALPDAPNTLTVAKPAGGAAAGSAAARQAARTSDRTAARSGSRLATPPRPRKRPGQSSDGARKPVAPEAEADPAPVDDVDVDEPTAARGDPGESGGESGDTSGDTSAEPNLTR